jgi:hypothetical protein
MFGKLKFTFTDISGSFAFHPFYWPDELVIRALTLYSHVAITVLERNVRCRHLLAKQDKEQLCIMYFDTYITF